MDRPGTPVTTRADSEYQTRTGRKERRASTRTLQVLAVFIDNPETSFNGYEVTKLSRLRAGIVYPILDRLARRGRLDVEDSSDAEGVSFKLYRLNGAGRSYALNELAKNFKQRHPLPQTV